MSTRALIIGIVLVLFSAAAAALLLRNAEPAEDRITINGEALIGGPAPASDTAVDPTEDYIRQMGPPDTSGLALMREEAEHGSEEHGALPGPPIGEPGPAFDLPTIEGGTFSNSQTRGRVALLNFWATWCEPCQDEIPGLIILQDQHGDRGLSVVGISIEEDDREAVSSFTEAFPFNYPLLLEGQSVAEEYGAHVVVPTTVILDRGGRIAARLYGALRTDSLEAHILPLLAAR